MKKLLVALALLLAAPAHAQLQHPFELWLGNPVQINGVTYVPVHINNPSLLNIHNMQAWDPGAPGANLRLTGTLQPYSRHVPHEGHLPGNYWPAWSQAEVVFNWGGDTTLVYGKWKLQMSGAYDLPYGGEADCASLPSETTGILAYLRFTGAGTVSLTHFWWHSSNGCPAEALSYVYGNAALDQNIYVDSNPPACYDCCVECGGEEDPMLPLKATKPRVTWGQVKAIYR